MTIEEAQAEIIGQFKVFGDWLARYNHLIELGKKLPPLDAKYRTEENLIRGCQLKVWFHSALKDGRVFYDIDSGSTITQGIIFLLTRILSGQKPAEIKNANLYFIDEIGLRENFSPTRANGLFKMEKQMKADATRYETMLPEAVGKEI